MKTRTLLLVLGSLFTALLVAVFLRGDGTSPAASRAPSRLVPEGDAPATMATAIDAPTMDGRGPATGVSERASVELALRETTTAVLRVHVIATEDLQPLSGVRLTLVRAIFDRDAPRARAIEGSHGSLEEAPRTDEEGNADFAVPAGAGLRLYASRPSPPVASAHLDVLPVEAGEEREFEVKLATEVDLRFFGRVLAREDDEPLPGARVKLDGDVVRTDSSGLFDLWAASWDRPRLDIEAEGRASVRVDVSAGHETADEAYVVRLAKSAALTVHVDRKDGSPLAGAPVSARGVLAHLNPNQNAFSYGDTAFGREITESSGDCVLRDLPPETALTIQVHVDDALVHRSARPLALAPGEERTLRIRLKSGGALIGRMIDQSGQPVAGQDVRSAPTEARSKGFSPDYSRVEETTTGSLGAFSFEDLSQGRWWVWSVVPGLGAPGPAPTEDAVASVPELVTIAPAGGTTEVELRVHRGLFLRGIVVDPSNEPVASVTLWLAPLSPQVRLSPGGAVSAADGSFVLGPLLPGSYELAGARARGREFVAPPPFVVEAGMEDVVVRMRLGGAIRGRVVDAVTNEPFEARLLVEPVDPALQSLGLGSFRYGGDEFDYRPLAEGSYNVFATARSGLVGIARDVRVSSGSTTSGVVVRVGPGARLRLFYEGEEPWAFFQARLSDVLVDGARIRTGTSVVLDLPPGEFAVTRSGSRGEPMEEKTVRLVAGEERELSFTDGD